MNIKLELLKNYISDFINSNLEDFKKENKSELLPYRRNIWICFFVYKKI